MRIVTPRATPVVQAPSGTMPAGAAVAPERDEPRALRAPVTVITPGGDLELTSGTLLIGRLPDCDVSINDTLVSRMHARLNVEGSTIVVEDLHSTNGVYVNGSRITHRATLNEGDRVLIGTTELSLFQSRSPPRPRLAPAFTAAAPPVQQPSAERRRFDAPPSTARADALKVVGSLAERLAAAGNLDEATRVLSSHLQRIQQGASAGLVVPIELSRIATQHALDLWRWTGDAQWMDYVTELHLTTRRVLEPFALIAFEGGFPALPGRTRGLLEYYTQSLKSRAGELSEEERARLERLEALCRSA